MEKERFKFQITLEVDRDQVPGFGYDPQSWAEWIDYTLKETIPHYNPTLIVKQIEEE